MIGVLDLLLDLTAFAFLALSNTTAVDDYDGYLAVLSSSS